MHGEYYSTIRHLINVGLLCILFYNKLGRGLCLNYLLNENYLTMPIIIVPEAELTHLKSTPNKKSTVSCLNYLRKHLKCRGTV